MKNRLASIMYGNGIEYSRSRDLLRSGSMTYGTIFPFDFFLFLSVGSLMCVVTNVCVSVHAWFVCLYVCVCMLCLYERTKER